MRAAYQTRDQRADELAARLEPIQDRIAKRFPTGREADKVFFDELSGDFVAEPARAALLFKGDDFSKTDIDAAV